MGLASRSLPFEPDPYYETTEEWVACCFHGVPCEEDCYECDLDEERFCD